MEKPKKKDPYYYKGTHFFKNEYETVLGFQMRDYESGMHEQDFYELNIITMGNGVHFIEDNGIRAKRGDVFIIPPRAAHGYIGGNGFDVYHLLLSDRFMEKHTAELWSIPAFHVIFKAEPLMRRNTTELFHLSLSEEQMTEVEGILSTLEKITAQRTPENLVLINSYTVLLIALLCNTYRENEKKEESEASSYDRSFMDALSLIHTSFNEKLTIERLAKAARLSRSGFIRRFGEICGMPPAEYITNIRLEAAGRLLLSSTLSVSEIASMTGFYDASHLSGAFKEKHGISPSSYRRLQSID